jgi:TonB family protein
MKLRAALLLMVLRPMAIAQDSAAIDLSPEKHVPICRGKDSDVPDCVTPPHQTYAPDPKYPEKARRAHDRGHVILQLVVGTDGLPSDIKVDRGLTPELEKAAIDAVRKWKFTPANKDGHPVPVQIKVEVSFNLY